jgi:RimJ/RimL family protein N-acetyltransferase
MPVELPAIVETDRLLLELLSASDAADVSAGRRQVIPGGDSSWGPRQIRRGAGGLVVGTIGFMGPPAVVANRSDAEVGYGLVQAERAAGLATEALRALVEVVDPLGVRVRAHVDAANLSSIDVLRKCGFTLVASSEPDQLRFVRAHVTRRARPSRSRPTEQGDRAPE